MNMEYSVVTINISRNTLGTKSNEFGSILVIGSAAADGVAPKLKEYFSLAEVLIDYPVVEAQSSPEYIMASNIFGQEISLNKILIGQRAFGESYTDAYTRIGNLRDFYAVVVATPEPVDLIDLATAIEASGVNGRARILGALEYNINTLLFTKAVHTAKLNRTFISLNRFNQNDPIAFMPGAWLGKMLPIAPGSANWAFKTLAGIKADEAEHGLTPTKIDDITNNKGNFYTKNGDADVTFWGTMGSGEYIDIIYGVDWLDHTMQQDLINLFNRTPKIDYTNGGISLIETAMRQSLDLAKERRVIDTYIITVPNAADISFTDKSNRELKQVTFQATLTGAINKVIINGYVTL